MQIFSLRKLLGEMGLYTNYCNAADRIDIEAVAPRLLTVTLGARHISYTSRPFGPLANYIE